MILIRASMPRPTSRPVYSAPPVGRMLIVLSVKHRNEKVNGEVIQKTHIN